MLIDQASQPFAVMLLAHGAGAPMDTPFMNDAASALAQQGVSVIRFNFGYMHTAQQTGSRRPPSRMPVIMEEYRQWVARVQAEHNPDNLPLWVAGKSMGGRAATLIAEDAGIAGAAVFGYPFHPPGKPEKTRTEHLFAIDKPVLIAQGERDTFGTAQDIAKYQLAAAVEVELLQDGDHSLKPRKASGLTQQQHIEHAAQWVAARMRALS